MITLQTADNALKTYYLDAVTDALNMKANPLLAQIEKTTSDVVGKEVRKLIRSNVNGGIGAGSETGDLPLASSSGYTQFVATLKNLYGTIEISDKAIRASANNEGAFVNLLNDEMQSLVKSASFNFGRMLFGDGTGKIASVTNVDSDDTNEMKLDSVKALAEGMVIDVLSIAGNPISSLNRRTIVGIDRANKTITLDGMPFSSSEFGAGAYVCMQSSAGYEITGLGALFGDKPIYGVDRDASVMKPYKQTAVGKISETVIQKAIDTIEENSGSKVNFIVCSWGVKRALAEYFREVKVVMPTMQFAGGFNCVTFNGIPVVADRFCPDGTMYLLNTEDFKLHQLCDWQWLEGEDGKILKQIAGKPVYTATLVKYAELLCERPNGQGMLSGITEA